MNKENRMQKVRKDLYEQACGDIRKLISDLSRDRFIHPNKKETLIRNVLQGNHSAVMRVFRASASCMVAKGYFTKDDVAVVVEGILEDKVLTRDYNLDTNTQFRAFRMLWSQYSLLMSKGEPSELTVAVVSREWWEPYSDVNCLVDERPMFDFSPDPDDTFIRAFR